MRAHDIKPGVVGSVAEVATSAAGREVQPKATGDSRRRDTTFTWQATTGAVTDVNAVVVSGAAHQLVSGDDWSWHIPADDAWTLGYGVARTALEPVEAATHSSAHQLLKLTEGAP